VKNINSHGKKMKKANKRKVLNDVQPGNVTAMKSTSQNHLFWFSFMAWNKFHCKKAWNDLDSKQQWQV